jgi:hypothetical protein
MATGLRRLPQGCLADAFCALGSAGRFGKSIHIVHFASGGTLFVSAKSPQKPPRGCRPLLAALCCDVRQRAVELIENGIDGAARDED